MKDKYKQPSSYHPNIPIGWFANVEPFVKYEEEYTS